jgi:hypothetical protein
MLESVNASIKLSCREGDIINCIVLYSSKLNSSVIIKFVKVNTESMSIQGDPYPIDKPEDIEIYQGLNQSEEKVKITYKNESNLVSNQIDDIKVSNNQDPMCFNQISQLN